MLITHQNITHQPAKKNAPSVVLQEPATDKADLPDPYIHIRKKHEYQRENLNQTMEKFYQRSAKESKLGTVQNDLQKADNLWGRLSGKHRQLSEQAHALQKEITSIKRRENERRLSLELRHQQEAPRLQSEKKAEQEKPEHTHKATIQKPQELSSKQSTQNHINTNPHMPSTIKLSQTHDQPEQLTEKEKTILDIKQKMQNARNNGKGRSR